MSSNSCKKSRPRWISALWSKPNSRSASARQGKHWLELLEDRCVPATVGPFQWSGADGGNDHWYALVMPDSPVDNFTWIDANNTANTSTYFGATGYLATVTSADENAFLGTNFSDFIYETSGIPGGPRDATYAWIGLTDNEDFGGSEAGKDRNGGWAWISGEAYGYMNWGSEEPYHSAPNDFDFVHYWVRNGSWSWNDDEEQGWGDAARQIENNVRYGYIVEFDGPTVIPTVSLSINNTSIPEAGGVATVTATLSNQWVSPVTVSLGYSGTATGGGVDYTASTTQIVIPAGSATGTATITAVQDSLGEGDETVTVEIIDVTNGVELGTQQVSTAIIDDEAVTTVSLSIQSPTIAEDSGVATVTAVLSDQSTLPITVSLGYSGTASGGGVDYTASSTQIVITPGDTTGTATITAVDDLLDEANETVVVDITGVTNGIESGTQQVTATITDDDPPPTVTLSIDNPSIAEASGVATVTATLSQASGFDVTVDLGFTGTASGIDYTTSGTQIVIPAGSASHTMTIRAVQDSLDEVDETVVVDVTGVTNGFEASPQQVTATITDDDPPPTVTLSIDEPSIAEAGGVAIVTATLSEPSSLDVMVGLSFAGTASAGGVDYSTTTTEILIPAGGTAGAATISTVDDASDEPDETVEIGIAGITNGTESETQLVTTTIIDDDSAPTVTLSVDNASITEAGGVATVTATLSQASGFDVTVDLGFAGSATVDGIDCTISGTEIVIPAGNTTGAITVTAVDDLLDENNETVTVDITGVTNGSESGTQEATITISDDDPPPTVTLSIDRSVTFETYGTAICNGSTQC